MRDVSSTPAVSVAKTTRPDVSDAITRARLLDEMSSTRAKLVWIGGQPGGGKTTLAASFVQASGRDSLWLRVDGTDRDAASYFFHLTQAAAAAGLNSEGAARLPVLVSEDLTAIEAYARRYFRVLFQQCRGACVMVFDDWQQVEEPDAVTRCLPILVEEAPPAVRIVITSREPPPQCLARALANGLVQVLPAEKLRLTPTETRELLHAWRLPHGDDRVSAAQELCRGWIAGLVLCRSALEVGTDLQALSTSHAPRSLEPYFRHEVFAPLSADDRARLCQLAWLPSVSERLAQALTGTSDTIQLLHRMAKRGQFVFVHRGVETSFTFHPLFAEFLRYRVQAQSPPGVAAAVKRRTAQALAQAGDHEAAIELMLGAEAYAEAAAIILQVARTAFADARLASLKRWITAIPASQRDRLPWLSYWLAVCVSMENVVLGRAQMLSAYGGFKSAGDKYGRLLALSSLIGSCYTAHSSEHALPEWLAEIEELGMDFDGLGSPGLQASVALSMWNGLHLVQPDHPDLPTWESRLRGLLHAAIDPTVKLRMGMLLSRHYYFTGQYNKIWPLRELLLPETKDARLSPYGTLAWHLCGMSDDWSRGRFAEARLELDRARACSEQGGIHLLDDHIAVNAVTACLLDDRCSEAAALLAGASLGSHPPRHMDVWYLFLDKTWHACLEGRCHEAREYAAVCLRAAREMGGWVSECLALAALCYARLDEHDGQAVAEPLAQLQALARRMDNPLATFHAELIGARLALLRNRPADCTASLRTAFAIGRRQAMFHFVLAVPEVLTPLYRHALEQDIEPEYVGELIQRRRVQPSTAARHLEQWPWPVRIYTLGDFSVRVNGELLPEGPKAQRRILTLLQAIIALGGERGVSAELLCDVLWPDADGDAAHHALESSLYRLRKLIGKDSVRVHNGRIALAPDRCWVDAWAFQHLLGRARDDAASRARAAALYKGPFLSDEADAPWALTLREQLHQRAATVAVRD